MGTISPPKIIPHLWFPEKAVEATAPARRRLRQMKKLDIAALRRAAG